MTKPLGVIVIVPTVGDVLDADVVVVAGLDVVDVVEVVEDVVESDVELDVVLK